MYTCVPKPFKLYLLQNESHVPLALTGTRFLPSFTSTCNEPLLVALRAVVDAEPDAAIALDDVDDAFILPNLRKLRLPPEPDNACCLAAASGGTNFSPTMMSPRQLAISSKGSVYIQFCAFEINVSFRKRSLNSKTISSYPFLQ